jgi:hypothetical protein
MKLCILKCTWRDPLKKIRCHFNLFTSFGYFENDEDNLTTLKAIKESLSEYGFAVIDFMNVTQVLNTLVPEETKTEDINFHIKRYLKDGYIFKKLTLKIKDKVFIYWKSTLTLKTIWPWKKPEFTYWIFFDYKLKKFHKTESERLIMILNSRC